MVKSPRGGKYYSERKNPTPLNLTTRSETRGGKMLDSLCGHRKEKGTGRYACTGKSLLYLSEKLAMYLAQRRWGKKWGTSRSGEKERNC